VFPQTPTISETFPDFEAKIWIGLFAPIGLPNEALERLRNLVSQSLLAEDTAQKLFKAGGIEPFVTSPSAFKELIVKDQQKYSQVIKSLNITLD
jgi:tripartite-type tricarboxylate transporter receptor subunit TctC